MAKDKRRRDGRFYIPKDDKAKVPKVGSWIGVAIMAFLGNWPIAAIWAGVNLYHLFMARKHSDYRAYANIIGDSAEIGLSELAAKMGKSISEIENDLQRMIDKGYLGDRAYLDRSRGLLVLDMIETEFSNDETRKRRTSNYIEFENDYENLTESVLREQEKLHQMQAEVERKRRETAEQLKAERQAKSGVVEERVRPEAVKKPKEEASPDQFEGVLKEIRYLNDQIADEEVSRRIDRIGELTASIFAVVREKPEHSDEVRKFMNYYLPTTFKLLKSYSLMEKQSYQGENITASRKKIEEILDTLIKAFEEQQDRLFTTEAMDVEADIKVLETMLAKDGLVSQPGLDINSVRREMQIGG